jgi:hypothetical protein
MFKTISGGGILKSGGNILVEVVDILSMAQPI